jgi:hypothetical protein
MSRNTPMNPHSLKVGTQVLYGRPNGEKTLGEIIKVNQKTVKVKQLETRGVQKTHRVGTVWTVPKTLCFPPNGAVPSTASVADQVHDFMMKMMNAGASADVMNALGEAWNYARKA